VVRQLLLRGMLAGVLAGLLAFGFAKIFGEPQVDHAIAFEDQMDKAKAQGTAGTMSMSGGMSMSNAGAPEPELVSRAVQAGLGLFTGVVVYGAAFGGLLPWSSPMPTDGSERSPRVRPQPCSQALPSSPWSSCPI